MQCAISLTTSNRCKVVARISARLPKGFASNPVAVEQVDRTVPFGPNALHRQQLVMYSCEGPFVQPNDFMGGNGRLFQNMVERPASFSARECFRASLRTPAEVCADTGDTICQQSSIKLSAITRVTQKWRNVARCQLPVTDGLAFIAVVAKFQFHHAGHRALCLFAFRLENHRKIRGRQASFADAPRPDRLCRSAPACR